MSALQRRLTEFLEADLVHSLGAFRESARRLRELDRAITNDHAVAVEARLGARRFHEYGEGWSSGLRELVDHSLAYAVRLNDWQDAAVRKGLPNLPDSRGIGPHRHPFPPQPLPLRPSLLVVGSGGDPPRLSGDTTRADINWPPRFYRAVLYALRESDKDAAIQGLKAGVLMARTPEHSLSSDAADGNSAKSKRREKRFLHRLARWEEAFAGQGSSAALHDSGDSPPEHERAEFRTTAGLVAAAHLAPDNRPDAGVKQALPLFVLRALVDGHHGLHVALAIQSVPLKAQLRLASQPRDERLDLKQLRQSVELLTFVRTAVRVAPHLFAEDDHERDGQQNDRARAWNHVVPSRTMWLGVQLSTLALYRRAHAHVLMGHRRKAYNDFHKLQAEVRDAQRRLRSTPLHVQDAHEFLQGLDALANYQIAELYRAERQFASAAVYFDRSLTAFQRLQDSKSYGRVIANSRWLVHLHLGRGKMNYELGRHKAAIVEFLRSWMKLLDIIARDTDTDVEREPLTRAIADLELVLDEPLLYIDDLRDLMQPIVAQVQAADLPQRYGRLASEVLLRLGHVLLVTSVDRRQPSAASSNPPVAPRPRSRLAAELIMRAAELDPSSTLVPTDLLRIALVDRPRAARSRTADGGHSRAR